MLLQHITSTSYKLRSLFLLSICALIGLSLSAQGLKTPQNIPPKDRICFAMYTVHEQTLKLTAQFYPIANQEPFEASLQIWNNGWQTIKSAPIRYPGYTSTFKVVNWDDSKETKYRVAHNNRAFYEGLIQKNPLEKDEFVVASFSCNSIYEKHGGHLSRQDIIDNMKRIKPDLLFFAGDQVYDHSDHLGHWLRFGRDFGEIIRNTPTIAIPDDHDIGQGNLWGAGGVKGTSRKGDEGGYYMPVEYVKEVERAQTSNLPDPYDPTPIAQGLGVYYTDLTWGGISFAILEDRKFKTGPRPLKEKYTIGKSREELKDFDPKTFDVSDAVLLGDRQIEFLKDWTDDWEGAQMKAVLSQTIFCASATLAQSFKNGSPSIINIKFDFDTNGWPQSGRNRALLEIRKSFSIMLAGDQHLGSVIHHGIDDWNDAGYSFASPGIANLWTRIWKPQEPGKNRKPDSPSYTGEFLDGFGNKITYHAAANPTEELFKDAEDKRLESRAAGYGIIRFKKPDRTITFECWPRNVDISDPDTKQYDGWPITISQFDNFNIRNGYELPTLKISKPDQVVTVIETESGEIVSSVRILGSEYQPKVHREGLYQIKVGESTEIKTLENIKAAKQVKSELKVTLN